MVNYIGGKEIKKKRKKMKLSKKDREKFRDVIFNTMCSETTRRLDDIIEDNKKVKKSEKKA